MACVASVISSRIHPEDYGAREDCRCALTLPPTSSQKWRREFLTASLAFCCQALRAGDNTSAASVIAPAGGSLMKQSRETAPLWVWLTFGLIGLGIIAYAAGYMVLEDIFALIK
jgi:hypothetical protein